MKQRGVLAVVTCIGVAATATFLIGENVMSRAQGMQPASASSSQISAAKPGDTVKVIMRIDAVEPGSQFAGVLLQKKTETDYRATSTNVRAQWSGQTKFVMGLADDLKPGAVLEVVGTMGTGGVANAQKLVMLTAYIHVLSQ